MNAIVHLILLYGADNHFVKVCQKDGSMNILLPERGQGTVPWCIYI